MKRLISLATLLFITAASSAWAGMSYTQTNTSLNGYPDYTKEIEFQKFDSTLGDLTAVIFTMALTVSGGSLAADNDGLNGGSATLTIGANGKLESTQVRLFPALTVAPQTQSTLQLAANDSDGAGFQWDGGADNGLLTGEEQTNSASIYVDTAFWDDYIGVGEQFKVTADVSQVAKITSLSGVNGQWTAVNSNGSVSVTYEYAPTAVPLPASIWFMGSGVFMMLGLKRKKR